MYPYFANFLVLISVLPYSYVTMYTSFACPYTSNWSSTVSNPSSSCPVTTQKTMYEHLLVLCNTGVDVNVQLKVVPESDTANGMLQSRRPCRISCSLSLVDLEISVSTAILSVIFLILFLSLLLHLLSMLSGRCVCAWLGTWRLSCSVTWQLSGKKIIQAKFEIKGF